MKTETNYNTDRSTLAFSIDLMEELKVEKSNNIQIFRRNFHTGLLTHVQEVKGIHKPVCLKFL